MTPPRPPIARCLPISILLGLAAPFLAGCMATSYGPYAEARADTSFLERRVAFEVDGAFHRDPPSCAAILPLRRAPSARLAAIVERALTRHLSQRLPRVIGPPERRRRERRLAIDLSHPEDRRAFARATDCPAFVQGTLYQASDDYVVVWARRGFGLQVTMTRASDEAVLWKARHAAMRADGGVPLSPVSAAVAGFNAARFHADKDMEESLADDVVRRIAASLPDVR